MNIPADIAISFTLNDKPVEVSVNPARRLSEVLREDLGQKGTKVGCNAGDCGACTVLADGLPVCACMVPAGRLNGACIQTVEGLAEQEIPNRLQRAFLHFGAAQCGICTPGMLVAATALLGKNAQPDEQQVRDALGGVLCRCTGYRKIIQAVMAAHGFDAEPLVAETGSAVGARLNRLDGEEKVLGTDLFGDDVAEADTAVLVAIRAPHHRATFEFGDLEAFLAATPGLLKVLTADDVPGRNLHGVIPDTVDQPVFAEAETRFKGEAVAAVIGEADAMKVFDVSDFPVSWTELPACLTPDEALADDAPLMHENRPQNILMNGLVQRGDLAAGFAADDAVTVEGDFSTGFVEHGYIEPEAGMARRVGDRMEIHVCTQSPYMDRDDTAAILGIDKEDVRIIPTAVGGGFGSKLDLSVQPYIALAAWHLNRPVRMAYSRAETMMATTKRHPSVINGKISADRNGKLLSMDFNGTFNTGAYASWGPTVGNRVPVHASGPYVYDAYRARSQAVHTNCPPSGAFRGFGVPQSSIVQETLFDHLADQLKIDRLDFRLRNALTNGQPTVCGQVFDQGVGIGECLESLKSHWQRALKDADEFNAAHDGARRRGVGVAGMWYGCGNTSLPNPSTIKVGIRSDGHIILYQGAVDVGQGANTVITQICADAAGLDIRGFELVYGDTDLTADAGKTSASRQTFITGRASYLAGIDLREKILRLMNAGEDAVFDLAGGQISAADNRLDLTTLPADEDGFVLTGEGTYDPPTVALDENGQGEPYAVFGYGAHMMELEVDTKIGTVKLIKLTASHDVGRAINPTLIEGQIEGGAAQGLGLALMEEFIPGRTENLHDYLVPTIGDVPEVESILIEVPNEHGPYGAKGIGEQVLIPTAPAILNAIRHATGAVLRHMPATPEKIRNAIQQAGEAGS
jgi:aldehyde oxidoreductase